MPIFPPPDGPQYLGNFRRVAVSDLADWNASASLLSYVWPTSVAERSRYDKLNHLYFAAVNTLSSVANVYVRPDDTNTLSTAATLVHSWSGFILSLDVDPIGERLFCHRQDGGTRYLSTVNYDGTGAADLISWTTETSTSGRDCAYDSTVDLIYYNKGGGSLRSIAPDGSGDTQIIDLDAGGYRTSSLVIAYTARRLFYTRGGLPPLDVRACDLDGSNDAAVYSRTVGTASPQIIRLSQSAEKLYLWDNLGGGRNVLRRMDLDGTNVETIVDTADSGYLPLVWDNAWLLNFDVGAGVDGVGSDAVY